MEDTREIYWTVGHGVTLPMYLFAALAFGIFGCGFHKLLQFYHLGKPLNRLDQLPKRVALLLRGALTQSKVLRVLEPGSLHALFFWGFGLLFVGTLLVMAQADFTDPLLGVRFLRGTFYKFYSVVLDGAGLLAALMLDGLLVRRFFVKPEGLETILDDYLVHALLFAIILTGFLVEAVRMAATEIGINPDLAQFSPVGLAIGSFFSGDSAPSGNLVHTVSKQVLWDCTTCRACQETCPADIEHVNNYASFYNRNRSIARSFIMK